MVTFMAEFVAHVQNMSVRPMCQLKIVYMHTCHLDLNTYHGFKETIILIVLNCPIMRSLQSFPYLKKNFTYFHQNTTDGAF